MKKTRTVFVQWTDDELNEHELQLEAPADRGRGGIEGEVVKEMAGRNVASYDWHVKDNFTFAVIYKTEGFLEEQNLRHRVIQDDSDMFVFQLTDYYCGYVQFDVDLIDFTIGLSYDANVTDQEMKKAAVVFTAVSKILRDVQANIKE